MEHVDVDEVEPTAMGEDEGEGPDRRGLTEPLGTTDLAINRYVLAPGEAFSGGLHAHLDQEEVFYVVSGTAAFETPETTVEVGPDEAVRFAPGEYQQGRNEGDEEVLALALGAPRDSEEVRVPGTCPDCGTEGLGIEMGEAGPQTVCPDCGTVVATEL